MPAEALPAALRLELDGPALAHNWAALNRLSGAAHAGAAVKADAYGVGARQAVPILHAAGCRDFFVTYTTEAADIIDLVDPGQIVLLHGPLSAGDVRWAIDKGVRPVINSPEQARRWLDAGGGVCDVMIDTGINRLGFAMADLGDPLLRRLQIDTLHSHLASAEEDVPMNALQLARWQEARGLLSHRRASLANSAGIMLGADWHGDLTRPGLALYGGVPCPALAGEIRQVVRPMAAIMQVRELLAGDAVGYNSTFIAKRPMRVGVVALGYADGYLRCWSAKGTMLSAGRPLAVLGRVSMDMTVIDLANGPDLREGDWIEIAYDLPAASAASGLSQYELLTLLGKRFAR